MKRLLMLQKILIIGLFGLILVLAGCSGDDGSNGAQGPAGPPGPPGVVGEPGPPSVTTSPTLLASESCTVCHGPNATLLPMNQFHDAPVINPVNTLTANIVSVAYPAVAPIRPVVTFDATLNGAPLTLDQLAPVTNVTTGARTLRAAFGIAKLIPGTPNVWQSYINRVAAGATTISGQPFTPALATAFQATTEGVVGNVAAVVGTPGRFTYTFAKDLANATIPWTAAIPAPVGAPTVIPFDATLTHRVGIQFTPSIVPEGDVRVNVVFDSVPNGALVTVTRRIATTASCTECHTPSVIAPRWGFHGSGGRVEVEFCVLCHNPGTPDPETGELVDLAVMVHKIHRGKELPSVLAGGKYIIYGNNNSLHDYSHVGYPQDARNCAKCHTAADAATPDGDNWMNRPSREACGACHDDISFVDPAPAGKRLHTGGANLPNTGCSVCHPATGPGAGQSVTNAHAIPGRAEAANFAYNIISVTNTTPGEKPVVTFEVTNPNAANARINILTDPAFTQTASGASRLQVIFGWKTGEGVIDWTNQGSGNKVGQPAAINALAAGVATANADGTFTVTSTVAIPGIAEGTGIAALDGHPASATGIRLPVKNAFFNFPITDVTAEARRTVVDIAKCDLCHDQLSIHGSNRTDSIEVCVICHNPNATDVTRRTAGVLGIDGKFEETIDFKNMIHAIHASGEGGGDPRTTPVVIYGFGGTANDFAEVTFPGNMRKCTICHIGNTWQLPLQDGILATTVNSSDDQVDPDDDGNITKTAGVCSACHDAQTIKAHMEAQGASFNVRQGNILE